MAVIARHCNAGGRSQAAACFEEDELVYWYTRIRKHDFIGRTDEWQTTNDKTIRVEASLQHAKNAVVSFRLKMCQKRCYKYEKPSRIEKEMTREGKNPQASSLCHRAAEATSQVIYSHSKEPEDFGTVERIRKETVEVSPSPIPGLERAFGTIGNNLDPRLG